MSKLLKFTLIFLFDLIKSNPIKLILVAAAITLFSFAGTIPDSHDTYKIVSDVKVQSITDSTYIYIYETISDNKVKYENIWSEKPLDVKNGVLSITSYHGANYVLWGFFITLTIILIVAFFIGLGDDDIGWEIGDSWEEAFCSLIYCEEEDGVFYYFALGRLINKRDTQIGRYYKATRELGITGFRDLYRCPKYQTKKEKRETLLSKLGIK
jgi:hypothetical protein